MNPMEVISTLVEQLVQADPACSSSFQFVPGWIDVGPPAPSSDSTTTYPCIRLDGLINSFGKNNRYSVNVKVWSQDTSAAFLDLAEAVKAVLVNTDQLMCEGYMHRPESALNSALYQVTFYA